MSFASNTLPSRRSSKSHLHTRLFVWAPCGHLPFLLDIYRRPHFSGRDNSAQMFAKNLYLPIFISKFFEPTDMNSEQFFARWKQLSLWVFWAKANCCC